MKAPYRSKTILTNLLVAALCAVPGIHRLIVNYPELVTIVVAAVNVVLRLVTREPVSWLR